MLKVDKKQVKIISVTVAALFILVIFGAAFTQQGKSFAAGTSNVGVVNYQMAMSQHPDMAAYQTAMSAEVDQAKKDFDAKSAGLSDQAKQDLLNQIQQSLGTKQHALLGPINDKVIAAVKAVADAKGLTVVVDKSAVVYGGQEITDEVIKSFAGK